MARTKTCSRCGGTGLVSKGQVVNGVCYGCYGRGFVIVVPKAERTRCKGIQYVILDSEGHHLALNTDRAALENMFSNIPGAVAIEELRAK